MANYASSGNLLRGSFTANIGGTDYIVNNFNPSKPSRLIVRNDENDEPAAWAAYPELKTATAEVQITATADEANLCGSNFTRNAFGGAVTWAVTNQSESTTQGGLRTYSIECVEELS